MNRKRITVPAAEIKKRCICKQCGREFYSIFDTDLARDNAENDMPSADLEDHGEHHYPHPDTWEP